ncbi:MAG TPA: serine hydrolase domain-containing protein [Chthoniobacterales bacterium]|jgi:CubicO group peptidase (beta-lactamase class C family)
MKSRSALLAAVALAAAAGAFAATPSPSPAGLDPAAIAKIDRIAQDQLKKTGAPSASIAVVREGQLAYTHAYGTANLERHLAATAEMQYSIGSISKQFAASALLLLAQEGKLSLDDKLARWFPDLTRANDVTVREILSMTAGYQDFWPEDYVMPTMMKATPADAILTGWARKPLDFEPGTKWQYSNTNYVIAGLIAEKASGGELFPFLQKRIFQPLGMSSVTNSDAAALPANEPMRYQRFGLGPPRPAPKEGAGWMFAAGELAMTAGDLAKWDISMINQTVLKPESYHEMETETLLKNGAGTRYGLGVSVSLVNGRRMISHGGEVSGFTAQNAVYPDDKAAVVVLTNLDASGASQEIANKIADQVLFAPATAEGPLAQARKIFAGLQHGKIDRALFTDNCNAYFTSTALHDLAASLKPLGQPKSFIESSQGLRGGMTFHHYTVEAGGKTLSIITYTMADGKLEQYIVAAE